jgi:hypothetical protein
MSLIPSAPFTNVNDETTGANDTGVGGFYFSGDSKATGLDRFDLALIADFWDRILVRSH